MPSLWGKSSSNGTSKKRNKESFIDSLQRKFKNQLEGRLISRSGGPRGHGKRTASKKESQSQVHSRSSSPTKQVARCQSFAERPHALPLPPPCMNAAIIGRTHSDINVLTTVKLEKTSNFVLPLPEPGHIRNKENAADIYGDPITASISSDCSSESDDHKESCRHSPLRSRHETGDRAASGNSSSATFKNQTSSSPLPNPREAKRPTSPLPGAHISPTSPNQRPLSNQVPNLQVMNSGALYSAPNSSMSSPSRSPVRTLGTEYFVNPSFWGGKQHSDVTLLGSKCSSPGSGQNSGHNSLGGDMLGQLFWQQSRGSPEYSPIASPRMTSPGPGPSSRIQSGTVTPIHPRAAGTAIESQMSRSDDAKRQSHQLPLPPLAISQPFPFSLPNSAATSPSVPRSPARESLTNHGSRWKKGKLLGTGTFGHVYVGFNSESGQWCAMKEVTLFADDAKSQECAKHLMQEITLLSRLRHPNIVEYYGSETVDDKLYIYLEYVSGGSIHKLLQEYGQFGEQAIRNYTQQILCGLAYLHAKNTIHRDIKGANILVDPNGRVKLADFGMAKHITGKQCPLSFKGSPYWMAPEVLKNSSGCNHAVDIWSLGCTVLEMATTKPPWSQYEGVAAMFKIGYSKELPVIPDHLSDEGQDFARQCLQRNPSRRPTAAQLLEHPFVKFTGFPERSTAGPLLSDLSAGVTSSGADQARVPSAVDYKRFVSQSSRITIPSRHVSDMQRASNISCPVSPIGSPIAYPRSPPHYSGFMSPSPISSPRATSGTCTPLTGGSGALPLQHLKQSTNLQMNQNPSHNAYSDALGTLSSRSLAHRERYVQQLGDLMQKVPSLELSPRSPLPSSVSGHLGKSFPG